MLVNLFEETEKSPSSIRWDNPGHKEAENLTIVNKNTRGLHVEEQK